MNRFKKVILYLKNHDFLAVTVACVMAVLITTIGFAVAESPASTSDVQPNQTEQTETVYEKPVLFKNLALEVAVIESLRITQAELTTDLLETVTSLQISNCSDITEWQELNLMPNLEKLTVKNCNVVSFQPFTTLSHLKVLDLSGNQIRDFSGLSSLTQLEQLNVSGNPILNLPNLSRMQNLQLLNLDYTNICDLTFLKNSSVSELHISYTHLSSFTSLSDCEKLEALYMYGYNFMDLSPLHQLPSFHSIFLSRGFDHSQVDFMIGRFKSADKYTKVYLALKNRGIEVYE